jgi:Ca2+-binding RTX toxin-like protein
VTAERVAKPATKLAPTPVSPPPVSGLRWYTDPYLAVGPESGAVYLNILKWPGWTSRACASIDDNPHPPPESDFDEEIQLWAIAPGDDTLRKVAVDEGDGFTSVISAGMNNSLANNPDNTDPRAKSLDHPRVAAWSEQGGLLDRVVVTFNWFRNNPSNAEDQDRFVTLRCDWEAQNPGCNPEEAGFGPGQQTALPDDTISFSNPRFDPDGDLYIAHAHLPDVDDPVKHPHVHRFDWDDVSDAWSPVGEPGGPPPTQVYFEHHDDLQFRVFATGGRSFQLDKTPALAVGRLGNATTPAVWLAWVTNTAADGSGDFGIEVAAADADNLSNWTPVVSVPKLFNPNGQNNWGPELALDGERNVLDVAFFNSDPGFLALTAAIWPRVTRYRANDLAFVDQDSVVTSPGTNAPRVGELPGRNPNDPTTLFIGEYIGLAMQPTDDVALVAWNLQRDEEGGLRRSDAAAATFVAGCAMGLGLTNGTSQGDSPLVTCSEPSTAVVSLGTFGWDLASLCEAFPLCGTADSLALDITATLVEQAGQRPPVGGEQVVGTAELEVQAGEVVLASELVDEALGAGSHVVEMCATEVSESAPELLGCLEQRVVVAGPLGSGEDGFGHFAGEVALDFVPLSARAGATALSVSNDGIATVHLPPSLGFTYYGNAVEQVKVGANGGLTFSGTSISPSNQALPTSAAGAPDIAVYWDDLDPSAAGHVLTFYDGRRFIVSWEGVRHVASGDVVSVQAHLYPDGRIEMHYLDTDAGSTSLGHGATATIGIQGGGAFVLVSHDDSTLLGSGVRGLGFTTEECLASRLIIPPGASCTGPDVGVTSCASHGLPVTIPAPDVADCAVGAVEVTGQVTHSGLTREDQHERPAPLPIVAGQVALDVGVHTVEWTPLNSSGFAVGEPFTQLVHVRQWATQTNCCAPGQTVVNLTQGADTFIGVGAAECVLAENGNDTVLTAGGQDTIAGGRGAETILSGADGDLLVCEPGSDTALGGTGPDLLDGGTGQDTLDGDGGPDVLDGGPDADTITGGAGADELRGRGGSDVLMGGADPDKLYPGSGVDAVFGDGGDDEIYLLDECELTSGKALFGGTGQDTLFVPPGITLADLAAAGVFVSSDIENVVQLSASHAFESDCG